MQLFHGLRFDNLRGDIFGGITAAVVALPLALAFGVASGAGPMAGMYGAIFVGFFAALFGGTPSQVSGPTGPMTVVMAAVITQYAHEPAMAFTVVLMGGLLQILFGVLRLGGHIRLVPLEVISGFMSGIGVIIIILQIAPLIGHVTPSGGTVSALLALPNSVLHPQWDAALVGVGSLALMIFTPARVTRVIPSPLIALFLGTAVVWLFLPGVPVLGEIPTGLPTPRLPTLSWEAVPQMLGSALVLALLGSIDSLLTSLIADSITATHHDSDRELIGQGIGNALAGLFGAIPGAGATMRTVINVRAGGLTPLSGVLHAVVLLAVVLGLGPLAGHIPHAVLAGILLKVGFDIVDWAFVKKVPRAPRPGVILMLLVLFLTVFVDLIIAVTTGIVAASLMFVRKMADMQLDGIRTEGGTTPGLSPFDDEEQAIMDRWAGEIVIYRLRGPMSFGAAQGITRRVAAGAFQVLILDVTDVTFIDTSAALALNEVATRAGRQGTEVLIVGIRPQVRRVMNRLGLLDDVPARRRFAHRNRALKRAAALLEEKEAAELSAP